MVTVWRLRGNIIRTVSDCHCATSSVGTVNKTFHTARWSLEFCLFMFLGCVIYIYIRVCFVLPSTVESFKLISFHVLALAPSPLLQVSSSLLGPLWTKSNARLWGYLCRWSSTILNSRCKRLPGCFHSPKRQLIYHPKVPLNSNNQSIFGKLPCWHWHFVFTCLKPCAGRPCASRI